VLGVGPLALVVVADRLTHAVTATATAVASSFVHSKLLIIIPPVESC
jgi:hypothetical protein